ncbi:uncharacterized protein LOC124131552 [Haliotis rufescens]|uniref:uncharacterized protein LOC124131552 n=1 Tax=Haliotis rufescens TaxID=6454 RepID=UPI00201F8714|nr:uncharacterized protein LOC124131552 [Haliotis rufescens]
MSGSASPSNINLQGEAERSAETMEAVAKELEVLRLKVREQEDALAARINKPVVLSTGRQIARFKDKASEPGDVSLEEWISDVRCAAETRKLKTEDFAVLLCENLGGRARQEILARGSDIRNSPTNIIRILRKVFGDGCDLPSAQHRFYSYRQSSGQDLVTVSLDLIDLYDKIIEIDPTFSGMKESALKGQLAEAVQSDVQKRETRRLTIEHPSMSFLDLRDRLIEWLGNTPLKEKNVHYQEHRANFEDVLKRQEAMIEEQQKQIQELLTINARPRTRACWECGEEGHMRRDCPNRSAPRSRRPRALNM